MDIGSIIGNLFSGGATGIISTLAGGIFGFLGAKSRQKHDLAVKKLELDEKREENKENEKDRAFQLDYLKSEADNAEKIAKVQLEEKKFVGDMKALTASIKSDAATYSKGWQDKVGTTGAAIIGFALAMVDVARGLIRPAITVYLVILMSMLWFQVRNVIIIQLSNDTEFAKTIALILINMIIFLTNMSVGWWFGMRPTKPPRINSE